MRRLLVSAVIATSLTVTAMAVADEPAAPTYAADKTATATAPVVEAPAKPTAAVVAAPVKPAAPVVPVAAAVAPAATMTAKPAAAVVAAPAKEAVAVGASTAPGAVAAAPPAAAAAPPPPAKDAKEPEPPLALRTPTPLALASEPAPTPWIYKVAFGAALLAAGAIMWRRRRNVAGKRSAATAIRVLGKTAMGLRGELALVEVGGMRLVVGITSGSMQTLAILPDDYVLDEARDAETTRAMDMTASAALDAGKPRLDLASRARSLFAGIDLGPPDPLRAGGASAFSASRYGGDSTLDDAPDSAPAPRTRPRDVRDARDLTSAREERPRRVAPRDAPLEGQARGIALALRNRR
jgi:MYXO-CTERM domain-containing protein